MFIDPLTVACDQAVEGLIIDRVARVRAGIAEAPGKIDALEVIALKAELLRRIVGPDFFLAIVAKKAVAGGICESRADAG